MPLRIEHDGPESEGGDDDLDVESPGTPKPRAPSEIAVDFHLPAMQIATAGGQNGAEHAGRLYRVLTQRRPGQQEV